MGVGCRNTDEISNRNWNAASHDEHTTSLEFVGKVDLSHERNGTKHKDWDGHVVDFE